MQIVNINHEVLDLVVRRVNQLHKLTQLDGSPELRLELSKLDKIRQSIENNAAVAQLEAVSPAGAQVLKNFFS